MSSRSTMVIRQGKEVKKLNINMGALRDTKHRGHALFRATDQIIRAALHRAYGPKTSFCLTEAPTIERTAFKMKGLIIWPVYGKETFFETVLEHPITVEFELNKELVEGETEEEATSEG